MSVVFAPLAGQTVPRGDVNLQGVAWNDGVVPLTDVRVSIDQGRSWMPKDIDASDGPYGWYPSRKRVRLEAGYRARIRR